MKHTQGKWKIKHDNDIVVDLPNHDGQYRIAQMVRHVEEHVGEDLANARLITAAPDLLEACEAALKSMEDPPVQCTGEWETGLFCGLEDRDITDRYDACRHGYDMALEKVREWMLEMLEDAIAKAQS